MKIMIKFFLFMALVLSLKAYSFSYDSAMYAIQKGDWQNAYAMLSSLIVNDPDNAQLLHDTGVVAHKLNDRVQAKACFLRAAELAKNDELRFDAYFKAGNVCVDDKALEEALELYDKALAIKSDNEYAQHNRDRVAKMLEEEKKQQEQDKQKQNEEQEKEEDRQDEPSSAKASEDKQEDKNEKNDDGNQQEKDQNSNADTSENGKQNENQGNEQPEKQQGNKQSESSKDELNKQQAQHDERNEAEDGKDDAQRKKHGDKKEREKKSANDQKRNGEHKLDKEPQETKENHENKQGDKHEKAPEQQHNNNDKTNVASQGSSEQGKDDAMQDGMADINDPWLINILNNQEEQDKSINKQLMEAKVRQHGGKNAQNLW